MGQRQLARELGVRLSELLCFTEWLERGDRSARELLGELGLACVPVIASLHDGCLPGPPNVTGCLERASRLAGRPCRMLEATRARRRLRTRQIEQEVAAGGSR